MHRPGRKGPRKDKSTQAPRAPETPQYSLTDVSNPLLSLGASAMICGLIDIDGGTRNRLIATFRTPTTTLTVGLSKAEATAWLAEWAKMIQQMPEEEPQKEARE